MIVASRGTFKVVVVVVAVLIFATNVLVVEAVVGESKVAVEVPVTGVMG